MGSAGILVWSMWVVHPGRPWPNIAVVKSETFRSGAAGTHSPSLQVRSRSLGGDWLAPHAVPFMIDWTDGLFVIPSSFSDRQMVCLRMAL